MLPGSGAAKNPELPMATSRLQRWAVFLLCHIHVAVCSGALALADAGIPTSGLVAAVSVGLMQQSDSMTQGATAFGAKDGQLQRILVVLVCCDAMVALAIADSG